MSGQCPQGDEVVTNIHKAYHDLAFFRDCLRNELKADANTWEKVALLERITCCLPKEDCVPKEECANDSAPVKSAGPEWQNWPDLCDEDVLRECCEVEEECARVNWENDLKLMSAKVDDYKKELADKESLIMLNKRYICALRKVQKLATCLEGVQKEKEKMEKCVEKYKNLVEDACGRVLKASEGVHKNEVC